MKTLTALLILVSVPAMAVDVTITIPDQYASRVIDAYCAVYGYQATIDGQPNPETKAQYAKRMLLQNMKEVTLEYEMFLEKRTSDTTLSGTKTTKAQELGL